MKILQRSNIAGATPVKGSEFFGFGTEYSGSILAGLGSPMTERWQAIATKSAHNRIYCRNINNYGAFVNDHYKGGTAEIYIIANGVMSLLRKGGITKTRTRPIESAIWGNKIATGTEYTRKMNKWWRTDAQVWFSVRAVDSDHYKGARSVWVPVNIPEINDDGASSGGTIEITLKSGISEKLSAPGDIAASLVDQGSGTYGAKIVWSPVPGAIGYHLDMVGMDPADMPEEEYIEIDGDGPAIPKGALVFVKHTHLTPPTTLTSTKFKDINQHYYRGPVADFKPRLVEQNAASEFIAYSDSDLAPDGIVADYFARKKQSPYIHYALHGGKGQSFYPSLEPSQNYTLRLCLRAPTAPGTFTVFVEGVHIGGTLSCNVTAKWQWFEITVSRNNWLGGTRSMRLEMTGYGTLDIAAIEFYDAKLGKEDLRRSDKANIANKRDVEPVFFRDHRQIKPGFRCTTMDDLTNGTGFNQRYYSTIYTHLRQCQINGLKPWLQVEYHHMREFADLVAFLAAPATDGHPMVRKRGKLGQLEPWTDVFDDIILEFGNEAWQPFGSFWGIPGGMLDQATGDAVSGAVAYGCACDFINRTMQETPWWSELRSKVNFFQGGHINSDFGFKAIKMAPDVTYGSVVGYSGAGSWEYGGEKPGTNGPSYYKALGTMWRTHETYQKRVSEFTDLDSKLFGVYEDGPSGYIHGLSKEQVISQELFQKSRAAGTGDLMNLLRRIEDGCKISNYFLLKSGDFWASHAPPSQGGGRYMAYGLRKMIWEHTGPAEVTALNITPKPTRPDGKRATYAFMVISVANLTNRVIVAANLDIDPDRLDEDDFSFSLDPEHEDYISYNVNSTYKIAVTTGLTSYESLAFYANVGNYREHNRYPVGQTLNPEGGFDDDPHCKEFIYEWDTVDSLPADKSTIDIDKSVGASSDHGLTAGNCILLKLTGCIDAV